MNHKGMTRMKSDKPEDKDIPKGWHTLKKGKAQQGDKYWQYKDRVWLPVVDKTTFLGESVLNEEFGIIIRKDSRKDKKDI